MLQDKIYNKLSGKLWDSLGGSPYATYPDDLVLLYESCYNNGESTRKGTEFTWSYSTVQKDADGEPMYGEPDGDELWDNPTTVDIDASNYSTYDSVTGIGRIVSDGGSLVTLYIPTGLTVGGGSVWELQVLSASGSIKGGTVGTLDDAFVTDSDFVGQLASEVTAQRVSMTVARNGACDVTFKLSVQKLPYAPAVIDGKGLRNDVAYSNEFTILTTEIVTLTTQDYCLQVFDSGSATCSYGTATVDNPLIFTATAGDTTFTPTGITNWMLTEGPYVHDQLQVGDSQSSTAGVHMIDMEEYKDGVAQPKAIAIKEAFRGKTDRVEVARNGKFETDLDHWSTSGTWEHNPTGGARHVAGSTSSLLQNPSATTGDRVLVVTTVSERTAGTVRQQCGTSLGAVLDGNGSFTEENTYADNGVFFLVPSSDFDGTVTISIQKLLPATCTLATLCTMGAGSDELPSDFYNIVASNDTNNLQRYSPTKLISSKDSVTDAFISATFDRGDQLFRITETNEAGTQFRVGYLNVTQGDASITYSSWATFDGSFDPLDWLTFAYDTSVPLYIEQVQLWDQGEKGEEAYEMNFPTCSKK